jgi:hypothetical protein
MVPEPDGFWPTAATRAELGTKRTSKGVYERGRECRTWNDGVRLVMLEERCLKFDVVSQPSSLNNLKQATVSKAGRLRSAASICDIYATE